MIDIKDGHIWYSADEYLELKAERDVLVKGWPDVLAKMALLTSQLDEACAARDQWRRTQIELNEARAEVKDRDESIFILRTTIAAEREKLAKLETEVELLKNYTEAMDAQWNEHVTCDYEKKYRDILAEVERLKQSPGPNGYVRKEMFAQVKEQAASLRSTTENYRAILAKIAYDDADNSKFNSTLEECEYYINLAREALEKK